MVCVVCVYVGLLLECVADVTEGDACQPASKCIVCSCGLCVCLFVCEFDCCLTRLSGAA